MLGERHPFLPSEAVRSQPRGVLGALSYLLTPLLPLPRSQDTRFHEHWLGASFKPALCQGLILYHFLGASLVPVGHVTVRVFLFRGCYMSLPEGTISILPMLGCARWWVPATCGHWESNVYDGIEMCDKQRGNPGMKKNTWGVRQRIVSSRSVWAT